MSWVLRARPHLLAACLCLGLAAANGIRAASPALAVAGGALAVGACLLTERSRLPALALAVALAGWWWGSARLDALDRSELLPQVGRAGPVVAAVTGPARRSRFGLRIPAEVRRFGDDVLSEPVLLRLPPGRSPPQGALVELIGEIRLPTGPEHGFDERAWLRRRGVHVVVRGSHWRIVGRRGGLAGLADGLRARLARSMAPGVAGERRAVLAGIVLGEDEGLSDELRGRFRASGLYHLLAVSGQNVALIAGGALLLAWLLGLPRWLGETSALGAIGGYVLAVGWQPSVVRAGVAGALASLAWLAARPRDRWYFLLVGAAILLAWNPYSLQDAGFQLSFAAVAAIFLCVPWLQHRLEGYPVPKPLADVIAVSTACGLVTAPILLLQFGSVPIYSVPANALAAPVVAPLLGLGLLTAFVAPVAPPLAEALGWLNGWLAAYLAACARLVGGLPYASVSSRVAGAVLATGLGTVFLARRLRPPRGPRLAVLVALALLVAVGWRMHPETAPPPRGLRITFLDVGQGDSALIQVPEGAVLVDEGPPEADVADQLRRLGIRSLAVEVLTHPQRDHVGGAAEVLERLRVGFLLDPRLPRQSLDEKLALTAAARRHVPIVAARAGRAYRLGRLRLRVYWPDEPGLPSDDPNNHAIVLVASYGDVDALLTADAESDVTGRLQLPPVEILKVAHHGSADPGLPELLRRIRPQIAVISVGAHNDYGHPTASTIAALASAPGLDVYRTDRAGRVVVESDGERISVRTEH
ncbi:MAG TPA: DNA internalization-related competence protein ComEC/Rec2 [Gaiellaceae bacterium]|jgi:competence protein ComEC